MNEEQKEKSYTPQETPQGAGKQNNSRGALVGSIIVVIIIIAAGIYVFTSSDSLQTNDGEALQNLADDADTSILNTPDENLEALRAQGASDEINELENELSDTNLENLDQELQSIENELEGAL